MVSELKYIYGVSLRDVKRVLSFCDLSAKPIKIQT